MRTRAKARRLPGGRYRATRHYLFLILFAVLVPSSFGQTPPAQPTPVPERKRDFGSSLKKYGKGKRRDAQAKRKGGEADDEEVVRVETDLVVGGVLVTNQKGNVILGLQKDDFVVTEDGVPQKVELFSFGEHAPVPRSIVLIFECGSPQAPYLKSSIEAAKILVDKLAPQDEMAIVTSDLQLRSDFTRDKTLLKKALDSVGVNEGYNMEFDALLAVLNEMSDEGNRQRIVIFQGDAVRVIWLKQDKDTPYQVSYSTLDRSGLRYIREKDLPKYGFSEVKEAIERSRATIYSVATGVRFYGLSKKEQLERVKSVMIEWDKYYGIHKEKEMPMVIDYYQYAWADAHTAGQTAMVRVAELSGGFADFIEKPEDAANVYSNIFTVIGNRYLIGYYPTDRKRDGWRREVQVRVRDHPEYVVTGRKAYFLSQ